MFRIDVDSNTTVLPTPEVAGTPGYFRAQSDPVQTQVSNDYMNMLQEEIINVILAAGLTPSKTDYTQLAQAIGLKSGAWTTGDVKATFKTVADSGWVMINDGSIGSATSGATTRANADTAALFTLLWTNVSNTDAPVSGGRGASAAADFAANKTLTIPLMLGRALGFAGTGAGLTARTLGQTLGEETHVLITAEMPSHTHTLTPSSDMVQAVTAGGGIYTAGTLGGAVNQTIGSTGGDGAHNNMQPITFMNVMIKL